MIQTRTATHVNPANPAEKVTVLVVWGDTPKNRTPTTFAEVTTTNGTGYSESRFADYSPSDPQIATRNQIATHKVNNILVSVRTAAESAYLEATGEDIPWPRGAWLSDWTDMFPEWGAQWNGGVFIQAPAADE